MSFSRKDVIDHLESCWHDPEPYRWFIDLSHPYFFYATAYLHLFADTQRWAMVFETVVWGQRSMRVELMTFNFGNCLLNLPLAAQGRYQSNTERFVLMTQAELLRLLRGRRRIPLPVGEVLVRDARIAGPQDPRAVREMGGDGTEGMDIEQLMRWLASHHPEHFQAREPELRAHLPPDLPQLLTLTEWHHRQFHVYRGAVSGDLPGSYETYPMLAAVLETRDPTQYRPTLPPNTHWSNWPDQGQL